VAIPIDESSILTLTGLVFIPLFIFLIKMIIEQGKNNARLDTLDEHIKETKGHHTTIELIRQRLEALEGDVKYLFRIAKYREERDRRGSGDREGGYYPDGDIEGHGAE
jgi:hypothetical protein